MTPSLTNVNGILPVANNSMLEAAANARRDAENKNNEPVIQGLSSYVRKCWSSAFLAKLDIEQRMLKGVRQRRGEYDPEVEAEIRKSGGSNIYMMLTSNKCRAASSWLRDTLLGARDEKPWTIDPTTLPEISPQELQEVTQKATQEAMAIEQALGMQVTTPEQMAQIVERIKDKIRVQIQDEAREDCDRMSMKMEDQMQEGGFIDAFSGFLDDLTTFPAAILKGPVVRKKPQMKWTQDAQGQYVPEVKDELVLEWERVDPFMIYPAPHASKIDDGYLIERHRMTRTQLSELIGVEGYSEGAIRAVLEDYGHGGLHEWLRIDTQKAQAEGKNTLAIQQNTDALIDSLQFWGSVQGRHLVEWGMDKSEIPDLDKEYNCEVWLIGRWVIKATLNYDPFGRKPYYKTSYEEIPGVFWGNSVTDLVRDAQIMCNAASRALANNMGMASGPQTVVNIDRLPPGEDVTEMYPWKIHTVISDPYGNSAPPIDFFQPDSRAAELMGIYEKFSVLADEYSGVPRYMTGDATAGGAGRTASGMSMLMNNAGKSIKQVISNIDQNVLSKSLERLYYYNMKYSDDPELKGDVQIRVRGANAMVVKEQAQVRINEFMNMVSQNPIFAQIIGDEGIINMLREVAKGLDLDISKVLPSNEEIRAKRALEQQQQMMATAAGAAQAGQPTENINIQRDENGTMTGAQVMPNNPQQLATGAPTTANFMPSRGV
jgi:hypothetical protein